MKVNLDKRKSWMKGFALSDLSAGPGDHHQCWRRIGEKYCAQPILITLLKAIFTVSEIW